MENILFVGWIWWEKDWIMKNDKWQSVHFRMCNLGQRERGWTDNDWTRLQNYNLNPKQCVKPIPLFSKLFRCFYPRSVVCDYCKKKKNLEKALKVKEHWTVYSTTNFMLFSFLKRSLLQKQQTRTKNTCKETVKLLLFRRSDLDQAPLQKITS